MRNSAIISSGDSKRTSVFLRQFSKEKKPDAPPRYRKGHLLFVNIPSGRSAA